MRARDVVGRRIVRVDHGPRWYNRQASCWTQDCVRLHLDNGATIVAYAYETEDTPEANMRLVPPQKEGT